MKDGRTQQQQQRNLPPTYIYMQREKERTDCVSSADSAQAARQQSHSRRPSSSRSSQHNDNTRADISTHQSVQDGGVCVCV
jgi:hypothetical protein